MQAVILAAGASSRFWPLNTRHKSLTTIRGKSLLAHTLDGLQAQDITDVVIVQGPEQDVEQHVTAPDGVDATFVIQESADGMGDALQQARDHITDTFVVTGPYRFDAGTLLEDMLPLTQEHDGAVAGAKTAHPQRYGMLDIAASGDRATGVVEKPDPGKAPSDFKVVSTYILTPAFYDHLDAVEDHEYSFEDALDRYMAEYDVGFVELGEEPPSLKYPWDAFTFVEALLDRQEPHIADSADVADSATIDGNVVIGEDTKIYENAVIRGPCYIGADCVIGNNAVVRSYTNIEDNSTVGANAEIRGSLVQQGFACHSGFIGDAVIGRDVAIGAGTVTANRLARDDSGERPPIFVHVQAKDTTVETERSRLGAVIGDGVDIGTQCNLMPGICIGADTFIGPSTLVKENVGANKTYYTKTTEQVRDR